jgi:Ca-activated chloride channel family protein
VLSFRLPDGLAREDLSASLQGHVATGEFHLTLPVTVNAKRSAGVARRWARAKIAGHMDQLHEGADPERVRRDVIALGTRFHLVTSYTSFVAVETTPTVSGTARTLRMPNTLPSGSHLLGLPRGGSRGPLSCLVGLVCTCLAFAILLLVWRSTPRPVS